MITLLLSLFRQNKFRRVTVLPFYMNLNTSNGGACLDVSMRDLVMATGSYSMARIARIV
jgi:hypothetical protein